MNQPTPAYPKDFNKERADLYLELARLSQASFFNRQSYEWKVAFGFWGAIGLITYFAVEHSEVLQHNSLTSLGYLYFVLGAAWFFCWQIPLRLAESIDKDFKHHYIRMAEGKIESAPDAKSTWRALIMRPDDGNCWDVFRCSMWTLGQSVFTAAFLLGSWLVINDAAGYHTNSGGGSREHKQSQVLQAEEPNSILRTGRQDK